MRNARIMRNDYRGRRNGEPMEWKDTVPVLYALHRPITQLVHFDQDEARFPSSSPC